MERGQPFERQPKEKASSQCYRLLPGDYRGLQVLQVVERISKHVTDIGGNVGELQATKLGKHFSVMMVVQIPADQKTALEKELQTLQGMSATVFETEASAENEHTPHIACKKACVCILCVFCCICCVNLTFTNIPSNPLLKTRVTLNWKEPTILE